MNWFIPLMLPVVFVAGTLPAEAQDVRLGTVELDLGAPES